MIRRSALAETRIVRRDHVIAVRQRWDQVAEHVRRCWKAVQQNHDRAVRRTGFAIEQADSVNGGGSVVRYDVRRLQRRLCTRRRKSPHRRRRSGETMAAAIATLLRVISVSSPRFG